MQKMVVSNEHAQLKALFCSARGGSSKDATALRRTCVRVLLQVLNFFQHLGYSDDSSGLMLPMEKM